MSSRPKFDSRKATPWDIPLSTMPRKRPGLIEKAFDVHSMGRRKVPEATYGLIRGLLIRLLSTNGPTGSRYLQ